MARMRVFIVLVLAIGAGGDAPSGGSGCSVLACPSGPGVCFDAPETSLVDESFCCATLPFSPPFIAWAD